MSRPVFMVWTGPCNFSESYSILFWNEMYSKHIQQDLITLKLLWLNGSVSRSRVPKSSVKLSLKSEGCYCSKWGEIHNVYFGMRCSAKSRVHTLLAMQCISVQVKHLKLAYRPTY